MQCDLWVDIHCHLLPYVDDGAETLEIARALLQAQVDQRAMGICLTPHSRAGMFDTPTIKIEMQYRRLRKLAQEEFPSLRLLLGREYFYDARFCALLREGRLRTLGSSRHVLVEFSHRHRMPDLQKCVRQLVQAGYRPVIAHIERYSAVRKTPGAVQALIQRGAVIQVNAGSILGWEGLRRQLFCHELLRAGQVQLVASDAHNLDDRRPNLGDCSKYLTKKYGRETTERLLFENPFKILQAHQPNKGATQ